ncbi:DNA-directed RNA polymerase, beta subunit [Leptospira biflexa serovar Patoc strain 'Patoc 1 (Ames)']|uniref:DNA-directed RNA polymerase subunit beta' n=2 Tax=Leptospira biflexa serovar Patoc TaxID=145259 RepID=RPOC_LEPBP|nr:DNA-directed RNA polymerase subunit beta' [Leptospira biflexa]B0SAG0.1 RecName: Full=DNA-directed RNA polymerase subunit beta'; Short=RNAP subunit beta'; AltName: Full=RNA polymerase subunit beta'; AltName: Full=Transcriptase subunit beta' [Leptospira biflexa serovar Patoc strain 'Patoc 1 (Ames)']B0SSI3.1 RecName: Full=DNA-directed RNA polymerase subunit beta'; Short=RNAP subunit beta'; AltName: Full=RNA polymerase subunit beta'; AltName: Full=Transcriptase subunit beta' [Leptospira biflexa se
MRNYNSFESITIRLASPERIKEWSFGEVKKPETINYRTLKPERDGLFCEKIFGTTKDWECYCGKFKSIRYKGVVCDKCGVEVTHSKVRRERMGHIELAAPVSHIWYYRSVPSRMGLLLDMTINQLKSVLYFEKYVIIDPADSGRNRGELIDEDEYHNYLDEYGDKFIAGIGGDAIKELLARIDVDAEARVIRQKIQDKNKISDKRIFKRLEVLEAFRDSGNRPEWMVLDVVPVIPPELRPMVQLEGGRFATSDLNDLYRRVINRNNRLKRLLALKAPEIIVRNEKRMLQEAVGALFDNSRRKRTVKGKGNRPLKSISDMLKGKQGRFRQNLLGKRVDYSGRSVIVVGPELKYHQMGLPKKMALELFKPFIMKRLVDLELAPNIKSAKKKIEAEDKEVFDVLETVVKEHPVLLNRAPTLHRLGIQAFLPVLVEGKAIKLHPLVCHAFNADFDGDQMAIHVPLAPKAQLETWMLMLSPHNILNPANGQPICGPTQDIVLGIYYLTSEVKDAKGEGKFFTGLEEVMYAIETKTVEIRSKISVLHEGKIIETTPGRLIFNQVMPKGYVYINRTLGDKETNKIIADVYEKFGPGITVVMLDEIKRLGYRYATVFAPTISIDDIRVSPQKEGLVNDANKEVEKADMEYRKGIITNEERRKKVIEIWTKTNDRITEGMFKELEKDQAGFNPVYVMAASGARGSKQQIRQLAGMRGLMAKPSGEIIELAIRSNFREGLGVLEFFISTHGARKGLADTALKTADAGYLTRRLVDISQDVIVSEDDCGTKANITLGIVKEGENVIVSLADRVFGRYTAEDLVDPVTEKVVFPKDTLITRALGQQIENLGYDKIKVRSPLTCRSRHGICTKCYGMDMARLVPAEIGEAVGTIAAQSIGQPGTQLTMRTFHVGGAASATIQEKEHKVPFRSLVKSINGRLVTNANGSKVFARRGTIIVNRLIQEFNTESLSSVRIVDGQRLEKGEVFASQVGESIEQRITSDQAGTVSLIGTTLRILGDDIVIPVKIGTILKSEEGQIVEENKALAEFDPYNEVAVSETAGTIVWEDLEIGKNVRRDVDPKTSNIILKVVEQKKDRLVPKVIVGSDGYSVPVDALLQFQNGDKVREGDVIFKIPSVAEKTRDITGGLPRVDELFEARRPKDACTLAEIDGKIEDKGEIVKEKRILYILPDSPEQEKVKVAIPIGKQIRVRQGDFVKRGDQLDEGNFDPHDILAIKGPSALHEYLVSEVQEVYRLQGVHINDKHIEVVVRSMLRKVIITDSGDTSFVNQQQVDKFLFDEENDRVEQEGGSPAQGTPVLLGLTKASLNTESYFSAASFQETTKVLTDAAIKGKTDNLMGLKENVIIGHMIPAGTGMKKYRDIEVFKEMPGDLDWDLDSEEEEEELSELSEAAPVSTATLSKLVAEEDEDEDELEEEADDSDDEDDDD